VILWPDILAIAGVRLDRAGKMAESQSPSVVVMAVVLLTLVMSRVTAQDDAGADMDMESMMGGDVGEVDEKNPAQEQQVVEKTFLEESTLAFKQLGVIFGVAFMVGFGFMAMVGIETLCEKAGEKYQAVTGKPREPEKDPAALVGTFSRYK